MDINASIWLFFFGGAYLLTMVVGGFILVSMEPESDLQFKYLGYLTNVWSILCPLMLLFIIDVVISKI